MVHSSRYLFHVEEKYNIVYSALIFYPYLLPLKIIHSLHMKISNKNFAYIPRLKSIFQGA